MLEPEESKLQEEEIEEEESPSQTAYTIDFSDIVGQSSLPQPTHHSVDSHADSSVAASVPVSSTFSIHQHLEDGSQGIRSSGMVARVADVSAHDLATLSASYSYSDNVFDEDEEAAHPAGEVCLKT